MNNNVDWGKIASGLIMAAILAVLSAIYSNQKDISISLKKIEDVSHSVDILALTVKHKDDECARLYNEAIEKIRNHTHE